MMRIKIFCLFVLLGSFLCPFLHAQEPDFTTWTNVGFEYKVKPDFSLSGGIEWRTKEDLSKTDRWGIDLGVSYKFSDFFKMGGGYELHDRNRGIDGWKFRHRYHIDGTLSTRLQRMKFSLRERVQHTFDGYSDEFRLRSRLKLAYDLPNSKCEPYVSVEMYNGLNAGERLAVKRMRYRGGMTFSFSARWEADFFYCRQWEQDQQKNIVGVECSYSF